jgi:hypothetical protein
MKKIINDIISIYINTDASYLYIECTDVNLMIPIIDGTIQINIIDLDNNSIGINNININDSIKILYKKMINMSQECFELDNTLLEISNLKNQLVEKYIRDSLIRDSLIRDSLIRDSISKYNPTRNIILPIKIIKLNNYILNNESSDSE